MTELSKQIQELRNAGKTYNQIVAILGCSKSSVCYHCDNTQKQKTQNRTKLYRSQPKHDKIIRIVYPKLASKIYHFQNHSFNRRKHYYFKNNIITIHRALKCKYFQFMRNNLMKPPFKQQQLLDKIGPNPICYLTGLPIDLTKPSTYQFDHIIPASKNGDSSLDNLGICAKQANTAKSDMTPDEFINLCKLVLQHNGYNIKKIT